MWKIALIAVVLGAVGHGRLAAAQSGVGLASESVIAARQAGMDLTAANMAAMKSAVEGKADVTSYADTADAITAWGRAYPAMFPEGTQTGHGTKAKPEVWSDQAGFEKAAANLVAAAEKLKPFAASGDKAGFATQFAALGQTCGACHRTYRNR